MAGITGTQIQDGSLTSNDLAPTALGAGTFAGINFDGKGRAVGSVPSLAPLPAYRRARYVLFEDFLVQSNGAGIPWAADTSGGTVAASNLSPGRVGQLRLAVSASGNRAGMRHYHVSGAAGTQEAFITPLLVTTFESDVAVSDLSTATDEFQMRVGLMNGSPSTVGYWFEYDRTLSANWQLCATNDGTNISRVDSGVAVVAGTYQTLRFSVNAGSVSGSVGTGAVVSVTTNLPASGKGISPAVYANKSAGSTARYGYCDFIYLDVPLAR